MLELFERNSKEGIFGDALLGLCLSENPQANEFVYAIGMMYDGGPVAEELSVEKIPAYTWAVFECVGPIPGVFRKCSIRSILNSSPAANTSPAADLIFRFIRREICSRISMCASYGFQLRRIYRTAVMLVNSGSLRKSGEKQDDSSQQRGIDRDAFCDRLDCGEVRECTD